jgi:16S rRNA (cytidine1402-2'-O)-methyltransferase
MPTLFLIPTNLNPENPSSVILQTEQAQISHLQHFIVETAKIGRMHLKQLGLTTPLQQLTVLELNKHKQDYSSLIQPLMDGFDVGLISDCGCPAVADPGSRVVSLAHHFGYKVRPLIGPSSILLSLMASGLNGQKFCFHGYLPANPEERQAKLKLLEKTIFKNHETQIFIEAPFRNQKLFSALLTSLNPEIKLTLASNLMTDSEHIRTQSIAAWKNQQPVLDKQEVIFLLGL